MESHVKTKSPYRTQFEPNINRWHLFLNHPGYHFLFWTILACMDFMVIYHINQSLIRYPNIFLNLVFVVVYFYTLLFAVFPAILSLKSILLRITLFLGFLLAFVYVKYLLIGYLIGFQISFRIFFFQELARSFHMTVLAFLFFLLISLIEEKRKNLKAESDLLELELSYSKIVLSPHFVFNCLSGISADFYRIAKEPSQRLSELAQLMYYSFNKESKLMTLDEDLRQVSRFIEFQQFRFGKRLHLTFQNHVDEHTARRLTIPKMILLTLVENVFKHGDTQNPANTAYILAELNENQNSRGEYLFSFATSNLIAPKSIAVFSSKIGLNSIRKILAFHYPDCFSLESREEAGVFHLKLSITYHEDIQSNLDRR